MPDVIRNPRLNYLFDGETLRVASFKLIVYKIVFGRDKKIPFLVGNVLPSVELIILD